MYSCIPSIHLANFKHWECSTGFKKKKMLCLYVFYILEGGAKLTICKRAKDLLVWMVRSAMKGKYVSSNVWCQESGLLASDLYTEMYRSRQVPRKEQLNIQHPKQRGKQGKCSESEISGLYWGQKKAGVAEFKEVKPEKPWSAPVRELDGSSL